jgi:hypothetical protein
MAFQRPRILDEGEVNKIRGKCLVAKATAEELMLLVGHFDLVDQKLRGALEKLRGCFPDKVYVYGAYGENWQDWEPDDNSEYEVIDFTEILGS